MLDLLRDYGLDDFYLELSTRGNPDKFVGTDEEWEEATEALRAGRRRSPASTLVPDPGGAAFYGPKISVQAKDAIGRTWQMSTIQVDFNQPERFGLEYQARRRHPQAARHDPPGAVRLDRAVLRRADRALRGRVPGLAGAGAGGRHPDPRRPRRLPGRVCRDSCASEGIRAEVDASDDRMQKKIRTAQQQKIPFMAIAGDEDVAGGTVSFRYRDGSQRNGVPLDEAVAHVVEVVRSRTNVGPSAA